MSSNEENYFYQNRKEDKHNLYFKNWVPNVFLPNVKTISKSYFNSAEAQYRKELNEAIDICSGKHKRKLTDTLS
jgi:hypothetical protein